MSTTAVTVEGIVKPDGTVEVAEKVNLPAGKVQVILVPLSELSPDDPFWQRMHKIWDGQRARGRVPRGVEEVESERQALRQEMEDEIQEAIRLQEECRRARVQANPAQEPSE
jgi:hypothetical protein